MNQPREIAEKIEHVVAGLGLHPGERIPAEGELVQALRLTRHQLRKGLAWLKAQRNWVQIQGSGTYLPGSRRTPRPKEKTVILAGPLPYNRLADFDECQMLAISRGYHLTVMNISQDPAQERLYLESIRRRRITTLCLEPTPIPPWNFDLVDALLADGIKVVLLNAPPELRPKYNFFRLDYYQAGVLGANGLLKQGVRRLIHVSPLLPSKNFAWQHRDFRDGIRAVAAKGRAKVELVPAHCRLSEELGELEWAPESGPIPISGEAGYLCDQYSAGQLLRRQFRDAGLPTPKIFATSTIRYRLSFPYALLDESVRLRRMMAYALDGRIPATRKVQEVIAPEIVEPTARQQVKE